MRFLVEQRAMKKFLVVVFFCLPACGQAAYRVGVCTWARRRMVRRSADLETLMPVLFLTLTSSIVRLRSRVWGPNTCDSTGMTTLSQCGNLTGVGTQNTPAGFGNTIVRVTNVNTNGNPNTIWQTYDQPSINAWNIEGCCPRSLPQC